MDKTTSKVPLKLGIVGLGRATTLMLPTILNHPHFEITAVTTRTKEDREKFARDFNVEAYESVEALCQSSNVDVVYIATPHQFHAEQAVIAAETGKHILVEKPIALSLEECERMNEAVDRNKVKMVVGPTHSFNTPVLKIAEIARNKELGSLKLIHAFNYTDFLYRPRRPEELDTAKGGGIIFNQLPHQISIIRLIGGGMVRSVRGATGVWDPKRPTEGAASAFLEFDNDVSATLVYSGYGHFDSDEFHSWVGESGEKKDNTKYGSARRSLETVNSSSEEVGLRRSKGYSGIGEKATLLKKEDKQYYHPHFGVIIASFEKGDIRISPDGIMIYGDKQKESINLPMEDIPFNNSNVLDELYTSVSQDCLPIQDGHWGKANLEVCLAIQNSSVHKKEVLLQHQVPVVR